MEFGKASGSQPAHARFATGAVFMVAAPGAAGSSPKERRQQAAWFLLRERLAHDGKLFPEWSAAAPFWLSAPPCRQMR